MPRLLTTLALALACASCLQVNWRQESRHSPVDPAATATLAAGETELSACLDALGAPLWVYEHEVEGRTGAVLAWGWLDTRDLGWRVSVPLYRGVSASLDVDRIDQRMRGVVLFFDEDWVLSAWREGLLVDLTYAVRRPPAPLEDDEDV
jgi:hypothetical protein